MMAATVEPMVMTTMAPAERADARTTCALRGRIKAR